MNPVVSKIWLLNFFAALFLAPLLFGIIAKVKAFFAGRKGIPLFQQPDFGNNRIHFAPPER